MTGGQVCAVVAEAMGRRSTTSDESGKRIEEWVYFEGFAELQVDCAGDEAGETYPSSATMS